jgi:hypothetical protein
MSQENVELVRRGIESVEAFWALLHEDVVWDVGADPPPDFHRRARCRYRGFAPLLCRSTVDPTIAIGDTRPCDSEGGRHHR